MEKIELGLDTFGDIPKNDKGEVLNYAQAIRQVLDEAILADSTGVDAIALGEHHRPDFSISSPEMVLAAIASKTKRIRLGSGVTVLSSDDPVRVFQRFSTLDALSNGRAEVILGRGSFTESFPLFGYDLQDYEILFEEKIELFAQLLEEKQINWKGTVRPALKDIEVYPKTESGKLSTWVGVGGSPESVVRAARYGFPLMLAIIGGHASRFQPYIDLYHKASAEFSKSKQAVGVHSPGFVADTDEEAWKIYWPEAEIMRNRIGRERGWARSTEAEGLRERDSGALYVGSPETVAKKIAKTIKTLGIQRFDLIYTAGIQSISARLKCVELYGTKVIPLVRELLAE